ncbi:uncharacterized protein KZ484_021563 [Pholidichthys leucotaenia]
MKEQQEPEPPRVKEEEEELFISLEGEQPVVKLKAETFMVTPICEENGQSEAEPNSEQVVAHTSAATEIQDEEGNRHVDSNSIKDEEEEEPKPKKRRLKTRSHSTSDDDCLTSKTLCENETGRRKEKAAAPQRTSPLWKVLKSFAFIGKREMIHPNWTLPHYLQRCRLKIC